MAKIIAFADPNRPGEMIWINPDAVEMLRASANGNTHVVFRSGAAPVYVGGEADFVAGKLNAASG